MNAVIRTVNLGKVYRSGSIETVALRDINLTVREGEFVSIMGPSGCGKSTLLHLMALMDRPSSGELYFLDKPTAHLSDRQRAELRRYHVGFVFQSFNLIEELTVAENIALPLVYQRIPESERIRRVNEVMERLNVRHKAHFYPMQLSGGHQQRVALARAIVAEPRILFADEPTGNLDSQNGLEIMEIFSELNEQGTTIVMVTHSPQYAEFSQRTVHLFDGCVVSGAISQFR